MKLARIGMGEPYKKKGWGFLLQPFSKYELWTALVKNFNLEAPYLSAIVDNPADILISYFHSYNELAAISLCALLRPSGEAVTVFRVGTIAPSFINVPFEVLILKVEL